MGAKRWHAMIVAGLFCPAAATYADAPPQRVVSMNVCTDQLAMLVARPGQLHSVSHLASDPATSAMAEEADGYVANHGLAEEIFLMKPDLVLAGTYSARTTVSLLRRLGFRVEEFQPEATLEDVRASLHRMGGLLGNPERAASLVAGMDAEIAALQATKPQPLRTALYFANSYTSGTGTLAADVVKRAGLRNITQALGIAGTVRLPLEMLVLSDPELVVGERSQRDAPALADQNFAHPAYRALAAETAEALLEDRLTVCGGPFTLEAARLLQAAAHRAGEAAP